MGHSTVRSRADGLSAQNPAQAKIGNLRSKIRGEGLRRDYTDYESCWPLNGVKPHVSVSA